jgi:putative Ca2+/H+ antiporter (TMEM165/GDT1 family)
LAAGWVEGSETGLHPDDLEQGVWRSKAVTIGWATIGASLPLVLSTFGLVFLAEVPDKTALASLVLATRLPPRQVIVGAWLAFLVQTVVAVAAGGLLQLLPSQPIRVAAGLGFLIFAVMAWRRGSSKGEMRQACALAQALNENWPRRRLFQYQASAKAEASVAAEKGMHRRPAWVAAFLVVFAAEWGDLTQLTTAALVAHTGDWLPVAIGALAALWVVTVLAALAGARLGRALPATIINHVTAVLFAAVGGVVIVTSLVG